MYGTFLMISEFTCRCLPAGTFRMRPLDVVKVKGKSQAVRVYEVYGETTSPANVSEEAYYTAYREAFELYLAGDLRNAAAGFKSTLEMKPGDLASAGMIARIDKLAGVELPPDWDGSVALTAK